MPARRSCLWWGVAWAGFFALTLLLTALGAQLLPPADTPAVFRGYYTTGFELSAFEPCGALGTQRYWLSHGRDPDPDRLFPEPSPGPHDDWSRTTSFYIRFEGSLSAPLPVPGGYGHLGQYAREVTVARYLAARQTSGLAEIGLALLPGLAAGIIASAAAPRLAPALGGAMRPVPEALRLPALMAAIFVAAFLLVQPAMPEGCLR